MTYNLPYATETRDISVDRGAAEMYQDEFKGRKALPVCRMCAFGVHPHSDQDCKVLLKDRNTGKPNGSQCCCTWKDSKEVD